MKKKFNLLFILGIIASCFILNACGGKQDVEAQCKVICSINAGENEVNLNGMENQEYYVNKGDNFELQVYFSVGYEHKNVSITLNDSKIDGGTLYYDTNEVVGDIADYGRPRILKVNATINSDSEIIVDATNCGLTSISLTLDEELSDAKVVYLKKEFEEDNNYIESLNSSNIEKVINAENNKIDVLYGRKFFLLLKTSNDYVYLGEQFTYKCTNYDGNDYLYNGYNVFYYSGLNSPCNVSLNSSYNEISDQYSNPQKDIFNLITSSSCKINTIYYSINEDYNSEYELDNVVMDDGKVLKSTYNIGYYNYVYNRMYIGSANSAKEGLADTSCSEEELKAMNKDILYINIYTEYEYLLQDLDYYLAPHWNSPFSEWIKIDSSKFTKIGGKTFLILTKEDVLSFIMNDEENNQLGYAYLKYKPNEEYYNQNYLGIYSNINENDYLNYSYLNNYDYTEIVNDKTIFNIKKSDIFTSEGYNNSLTIGLGSVTSSPLDALYLSARISITNESGTYSKTLTTTFDEADNNYKEYMLDLSGAENEKILYINVSYTTKPFSTETFTVSFEKLQLESGNKLYISTNPFADFNEWTEVTKDLSGVTISKNQGLYYIIVTDDFSANQNKLSLKTSDESIDLAKCNVNYGDLREKYIEVTYDESNNRFDWVKKLSIEDNYLTSTTLYLNFC